MLAACQLVPVPTKRILRLRRRSAAASVTACRPAAGEDPPVWRCIVSRMMLMQRVIAERCGLTGEVQSPPCLLPADVPRRIRELIADNNMGVGDRLPPERELAITLGVSRPALREGLRRLIDLGALEPRQGSGTYVAGVDQVELLEVPRPAGAARSEAGGQEPHRHRRGRLRPDSGGSSRRGTWVVHRVAAGDRKRRRETACSLRRWACWWSFAPGDQGHQSRGQGHDPSG